MASAEELTARIVVVHVTGALDHAAIQTVAGALFNLPALVIRGAILRAFNWDIGEPVPQAMRPEFSALPILFGTDRKSGGLSVAVSDRKSRLYHNPGLARQSDRWLHAARHIQGKADRQGCVCRTVDTRRIFGGAFIIKCYGGNVYKRAGKARLLLHKLYSPAIPRELPRDQSRDAFDTTASAVLAKRPNHESGRLLAR